LAMRASPTASDWLFAANQAPRLRHERSSRKGPRRRRVGEGDGEGPRGRDDPAKSSRGRFHPFKTNSSREGLRRATDGRMRTGPGHLPATSGPHSATASADHALRSGLGEARGTSRGMLSRARAPQRRTRGPCRCRCASSSSRGAAASKDSRARVDVTRCCEQGDLCLQVVLLRASAARKRNRPGA
jgi:hypothetical protein